jgi:hypothetical protein
MSELVRRRRSTSTTLGAVLGTLALCLRLVWPGPMVPLVPDATLASIFGEHALCLAGPLADERTVLPSDQKPPSPGDHADHDGMGCCLWHAAVDFTLPRISAFVPVAFVERPLPRLAPVAPALSSQLIGPVQARAPPEAA